MKIAAPLILLISLPMLSACERAPTQVPSVSATAAASAPVPAPAVPAGRLEAVDWPLPSPTHEDAALPDLIVAPDGRLWLSWIQSRAGKAPYAFRLAAADREGRWQGEPMTIASGSDWFVNWADTPHIALTADGALWAHWLQKSVAAPYAYDVMLVRSDDGGRRWSAPLRVNTDGKPTEHGFVSFWPAGGDRLGVAWLDGRNVVPAAAGHHGHGSGAMSLRAAFFDAQLRRDGEAELDAMTCDCCQTDVALTARGPLLVYRDRTPEEIRDIAVMRHEGGTWTPSRAVHKDGWTMPACPVNGPSVAAQANDVAIAWYTAAGGTPTLKLAYSRDAGDRFGEPRVIDSGDAVQGRVQTALDEHAVWVLWLREQAQGQTLHLARVSRDLTREFERVEVAKLQGRGRATGFAQWVVSDGAAYVVWTDVVDGRPRLRGARYVLR